jgi:hypothetical protein
VTQVDEASPNRPRPLDDLGCKCACETHGASVRVGYGNPSYNQHFRIGVGRLYDQHFRIGIRRPRLALLTSWGLNVTSRSGRAAIRIIAQQQKLIDRRKLIGIDTERSTLLLATLNELMATYQLHRQRIVAALVDGKAD